MAHLEFSKEITALLVIDPYNELLSAGGKIWDRIKKVAEANDCIPHMMQVLDVGRKARLRVFMLYIIVVVSRVLLTRSPATRAAW
jgi:ureidoacrylate peracid hydrolase